jgi:hypothetical protein
MVRSALRETATRAVSARESSCLVEQLDDLADASSKAAECSYHLFVRHAHGDFAKRYMDGEQCIALRRVENFAGSETTQDGFIIHALNGFRSADNYVTTDHEISGHVWRDRNQSFVLAHDVEFVEGPYGGIPSLIRPERFDRGSLALGKPLFAFYAINAGQRIDHAMGTVVDRKVSFGVSFFAIALGQGSSKQIEATTQGIENGTDPRIESERERLVINDSGIVAAAVRMRLFDNRIWVSLPPMKESFLEQFDLGYGPIDGSLCV